jgi:integrase
MTAVVHEMTAESHRLCGHAADTADMTAHLNETVVKNLQAPPKGNKLYYFPDATLQGAKVPRGFAVRVTAGGAKGFVLNYRQGVRERRFTIGRWPDWSALQAVQVARELRRRVDRGEDIFADRAPGLDEGKAKAKVMTIGDVLDQFVERYVERNLKRPANYTQVIDRLLKPLLGPVPIHELRRRHIVEMLDKIEDGSRRRFANGRVSSGKAMADRTVAYLSSALSWWAERDDEFEPPNLKRTRRNKSTGRDRVLSDDELRAMLPVFDRPGLLLGPICKFLLYTGQRRGDAAGITWQEIDGDTWTIPAQRYKTGVAQAVPLSAPALAILEAQPRGKPDDLVFPGRNGKRISDGGGNKAVLDSAIAAANGGRPVPHWVVHDLRRTARSLMARAGVRPDVAERVLGHVVGGRVERTYDRHAYLDEKRDALERLAAMVERILNPAPAKVVALDERRQSTRP